MNNKVSRVYLYVIVLNFLVSLIQQNKTLFWYHQFDKIKHSKKSRKGEFFLWKS